MSRSLTLPLIGATALALGTLGASAQQPFKCGTDEVRRQAIAKDPHILQREAELETFIQHWIAEHRGERDADTIVYTIPMVFHVLHMEGPENISNEQILDEMFVLNRDYRKLNTDIATLVPGYELLAADIRLQFKLATIDPYGNCTTGIERLRTVETFQGDNGSKIHVWPRDRYLNVWTVSRINSGAAGYSQYPSAVEGANSAADGVMIVSEYIGRTGTGQDFRSRALTHEVGHYLNLQHVWGDTNGEDNAPPGNMISVCGDDAVFDTPITKGHDNCENRFDFTCSTREIDSVYTFDNVTTNSGSVDPHGTYTLVDTTRDDTNAVMSAFSAHGVSGSSFEGQKFAFAAWPGGSIDGDVAFADLDGDINTAKYYEFTITPELRHIMTLTGITFKVSRSITGPRTFAVRSSVNNFGQNIPLSVTPANPGLAYQTSPKVMFFVQDNATELVGTKVVFPTTGYTQETDPITFRIYAWNAEDAFGTFGVDDVDLVGPVGIIENVENYMEYSYCSKMFTIGQAERMRAALRSSVASRNELFLPSTLAATGIDGINDRVCAPEADFTLFNRAISFTGGEYLKMTPAGTHFYCIGEDVQFFDNSQRGFPTSWSWTFQDGTPATSNERDPEVSFSSGGWKTVSLTAGNDQGSSTVTNQFAVFIAYPFPAIPGAISEGFEAVGSADIYFVENYEGNTSQWQRVTGAGHESNASMRLNAFESLGINDYFIDNGANDIDALITPTMDLTWLDDGGVTFWYAYCTNTTDLDDATERLEVWVSADCGQNWKRNLELTGADLITNGANSSYYVPTTASEWRQASFDLSSSQMNDQVRLKFIYYSGGASDNLFGGTSNNLYIDDIQMTGTVGLGELDVQETGLTLAPNPTDGSLSITYVLPAGGSGELRIMDAQGRLVWSRPTRQVAQERVVLDTRALSLASGVYTVQLAHEQGNRTQRLVVR